MTSALKGKLPGVACLNIIVTEGRVYHFDEEDKAAIAQSDEDIRLGRYASDKEVEGVFGRFSQA